MDGSIPGMDSSIPGIDSSIPRIALLLPIRSNRINFLTNSSVVEMLTFKTFEPHVQEMFQLQINPSQLMDVVLVNATEKNLPHQEQFSLLFQGSNEYLLPQAIYTLEHQQLGEFQLFLVPVSQDQTSYYYEAVFNRLLPTS